VRFTGLHGEVLIRLPLGYDANGNPIYPDEDAWEQEDLETIIPFGAQIKVGHSSVAIIGFPDLSTLELRSNGVSMVEIPRPETCGAIRIIFGRFWAKVKRILTEECFEVEMSQAAIGIKETELVLEEDGQRSVVKVVAGAVELRSKHGGEQVMLRSGEKAEVTAIDLIVSSFDVNAERTAWQRPVPDGGAMGDLLLWLAVGVLIVGAVGSVYSWLFSSGARDGHSEGTVGVHGRAVGTVVAPDPRDNGSCARKLAPARTRFSTGGAGRHQGESSSCAVHKSSKPAGKSRVVAPAWPPTGRQSGSGAPRLCSPTSEHFGMVRHPTLQFRPAGRSTELPLTRNPSGALGLVLQRLSLWSPFRHQVVVPLSYFERVHRVPPSPFRHHVVVPPWGCPIWCGRNIAIAPLEVMESRVRELDLPSLWVVRGVGETAALKALDENPPRLSRNGNVSPERLCDRETDDPSPRDSDRVIDGASKERFARVTAWPIAREHPNVTQLPSGSLQKLPKDAGDAELRRSPRIHRRDAVAVETGIHADRPACIQRGVDRLPGRARAGAVMKLHHLTHCGVGEAGTAGVTRDRYLGRLTADEVSVTNLDLSSHHLPGQPTSR